MNLEAIRYLYLRRFVTPVLGAIGFDATCALARWLARGVFELNTNGRRRAEDRLHLAMGGRIGDGGETAPTTANLVAAMYDNIGRFWAEALFAKRLLRESSWRRFVQVRGEADLADLARGRRGCVLASAGAGDSASATGGGHYTRQGCTVATACDGDSASATGGRRYTRRGCVLATACYGNPAVAACALGQIFRPVHVIVDAFAEPQLRAWQDELYRQPHVRPIDRREALWTVPAVLAAGGAVLTICEHERRRGKVVAAPFLGRVLRCYPTLGRLARWFGVPIGVVTCRRGPAEGFAFTLELHGVVEADAEGDDDAVVRRVTAMLERAILAHPEQYLWSMPVGAMLAGSR